MPFNPEKQGRRSNGRFGGKIEAVDVSAPEKVLPVGNGFLPLQQPSENQIALVREIASGVGAKPGQFVRYEGRPPFVAGGRQNFLPAGEKLLPLEVRRRPAGAGAKRVAKTALAVVAAIIAALSYGVAV